MQGVYTKEVSKFFNGPAGRLEAQFSEPPGSTATTPLAVICHPHPLHQGSMDNKVVTTVARAWQQLGFITVRFNFRGVGKSEGNYDNGIGEVEDLKALMNELRLTYPSAPLWLAGFSFGSFIAFQMAGQALFPLQALLSVAPPISHFGFSTHKLPSCPWFILQGQLDTLVPFQQVQAWFKDLQTQKPDVELLSFPKADHFFHGCLIELREAVQTLTQPLLASS